MRIAFTVTFDLNLGIAKLSLLITLCTSYIYIPHWNFQLHCLNRLQICPLSETRKGDSFSNNVSLAGLANKLLYSRVRPQHVCSKRYFRSPRRPLFVTRRTRRPARGYPRRKYSRHMIGCCLTPLGLHDTCVDLKIA